MERRWNMKRYPFEWNANFFTSSYLHTHIVLSGSALSADKSRPVPNDPALSLAIISI